MIWLHGSWRRSGSWPLDDRGLLFGDAVIETLRVDSGRVRWPGLHRARLVKSLRAIGLGAGEELFDAIVAKVPQYPAASSLRITITAGRGATIQDRRGLPAAFALLRPRPSPAKQLRVSLAEGRRGTMIPSSVKHPCYLGEIIARTKARGFDDVIVRNAAGRPSELTTANLFVVRGRTLLTPPLSEGILPGITRALVLKLAPRLRLRVREQRLTDSLLDSASEAFATSTLRGVCPITTLGRRRLRLGEATFALRLAVEQSFAQSG